MFEMDLISHPGGKDQHKACVRIHFSSKNELRRYPKPTLRKKHCRFNPVPVDVDLSHKCAQWAYKE